MQSKLKFRILRQITKNPVLHKVLVETITTADIIKNDIKNYIDNLNKIV